MKSPIARLWLGMTLALLTGIACAQTFPAKPIRWIVPYAPGGGQDFIARTIGAQMSIDGGQPVVIENKPGGNSSVAASDLLRSPADGYTVMSIDNGHAIFNPVLYRNLSYNVERDMALVTTTGRIPLLLIAGPGSDATSATDFIAKAKAAPGRFNYASPGAGTPHHIAMELLKQRAAIHVVHIPYRGGAPALADVAGGQIPVMIGDLAFSLGFIKAGKVRALAVADAKRVNALPDVPTFKELGVDGMEAVAFSAVATHGATPPAVVGALSQAIARALADPGVAAKLTAASVEPWASTPEAFRTMVREESRRWHKLIADQGISVD